MLGAAFVAAGVYALKVVVWPYLAEALNKWKASQGDAAGARALQEKQSSALAEAIQVRLGLAICIGFLCVTQSSFDGLGVRVAVDMGHVEPSPSQPPLAHRPRCAHAPMRPCRPRPRSCGTRWSCCRS